MDRCLLDVINDHGALEEFLEPDSKETPLQPASNTPPTKDVIAEAWSHADLTSLSQHDLGLTQPPGVGEHLASSPQLIYQSLHHPAGVASLPTASPLQQKHASAGHLTSTQPGQLTHSPLSQPRPSPSPQQLCASPAAAAGSLCGGGLPQQSPLSQPAPSPAPTTPSPLPPPQPTPQGLPRSISPMIRTGHVINQNQVVNSSIHQQLGVPVVTMMSGLTAISQPQIHTAANMPQPNTQVAAGTQMIQTTTGLVNLNQLRPARAIQIRPQPAVQASAAAPSIQPASVQGQMNIQGTLIQTSSGKFLIQGQQLAPGQPINVANLQNLQALQGIQLRPQQVAPPSIPQGQGMATAQLVRTPQGQQIIIQHAAPPQPGALQQNQNIILRTFPSNVIQIPGGGAGGVGISQGVVGQPGLGIIQQVAAAAPGQQQTVTNIGPSPATSLSTQPGQPPPAAGTTQIQGQLEPGKGMLTINVGGQNINIGQLNLQQQLKGGGGGGLNVVPNMAAATSTAGAQMKQTPGIQISNLQAQIAQLQALQQQQMNAAGQVTATPTQIQATPTQIQATPTQMQATPTQIQATPTQIQGLQGVPGQTLTVLPQQQQTLALPQQLVAPSAGFMQVPGQGLVLGQQTFTQVTGGLSTAPMSHNVTSTVVTTQAAPRAIQISQNAQHTTQQLAVTTNQNPTKLPETLPTPAAAPTSISHPDPLQAALMESQIGPLDSDLMAAPPPNQVAPPLAPPPPASLPVQTSASSKKSAATAAGLKLPSTAVVFPQQPHVSSSQHLNIPQPAALTKPASAASSPLQLPQPRQVTTPAKLPLPPRRHVTIRPAAPTTAGVVMTTAPVSSSAAKSSAEQRPGATKPIATVPPTTTSTIVASTPQQQQNVQFVQNAMSAAQSAVQAAQLQAQTAGQTPPRVQTITLNPHTRQMLVKVQNRIQSLQKMTARTPQDDQELQKLVDVYQKIIQQARMQAQQLVQQTQPQAPGGQPVIPHTASTHAVTPTTTAQTQLKLVQQQPNVQMSTAVAAQPITSAGVLPQSQVLTITSGTTASTQSAVMSKPVLSAPPQLLVKASADSATPANAAVVNTVTQQATQPAKLPIPANPNIAQIRVGNQIIHVQAYLKEKAQAQLAKLTPEQQQLFFKHQQALITQRQRQMQQAEGATSTTANAAVPTSTALTLPLTIQPGAKVITQLKPLVAGQVVAGQVVAGQVVAGQVMVADRGIKRPAPPPTISKSALIQQHLAKDQATVLKPNDKSPFKNRKDAVRRLLRWHVFHAPEPLPAQIYKEEEAFEDQSQTLLNKFSSMLGKYRSLLYQESMRAGQTSEMVMIERIFLNDEKDNFEAEKKLAVEDPDSFVPLPVPASSHETEESSEPNTSSSSLDASPRKRSGPLSPATGNMCTVRSSSSKDGLKIVIKNLQNSSTVKTESKSSKTQPLKTEKPESSSAQVTAEKDRLQVDHNLLRNIKTEPGTGAAQQPCSSASAAPGKASILASTSTSAPDPVETDVHCQNGFLMDFLKKEPDDDVSFLNEIRNSKMEDEAYIKDVVSPQLPFEIYSDKEVMKQAGAAAGYTKPPHAADVKPENTPADGGLPTASSTNQNLAYSRHGAEQPQDVMALSEMHCGPAGEALHHMDMARFSSKTPQMCVKTENQDNMKRAELSSGAHAGSIAGLFDDVSDADSPVSQVERSAYSTTDMPDEEDDDDDFDMAEFDRLQSGHSMSYSSQQSDIGDTTTLRTAQSHHAFTDFIDQNLNEPHMNPPQHTNQTNSAGQQHSIHLADSDSMSGLGRRTLGSTSHLNRQPVSMPGMRDTSASSVFNQQLSPDSHKLSDFSEDDPMQGVAPAAPSDHPDMGHAVFSSLPTTKHYNMFEEEEEEKFGENLNEQVESAINSILSLQQLQAPGGATHTHHQGGAVNVMMSQDSDSDDDDDGAYTDQAPAVQHVKAEPDSGDDDDMDHDLDAAVQSILL